MSQIEVPLYDPNMLRPIDFSALAGPEDDGHAPRILLLYGSLRPQSYSRSVAQEGARAGITVNAICPGYIATEMVMAVPEKVRESIIAQIPAGRLGEASEIARCVVFLASDDAGFITGSTMTANGGQYMT